MKISLNEIHQVFDFLIKEEKSREDIANWAQKYARAHDDGLLEYDPPSEKDRIWDGIGYLTGVDLLNVIDGGYLYIIEDFIDYRKESGL